jgi:hypothetical protein
MKKASKRKSSLILLGWREWATLPDLRVRNIKAKLDTGARTSTLHAFRLQRYTRDGRAMVRFEVHPVQRSRAATVAVEATVLDERKVRNSGGGIEIRPVIETTLELAGVTRWGSACSWVGRRCEVAFSSILRLRSKAGADRIARYSASNLKARKKNEAGNIVPKTIALLDEPPQGGRPRAGP